MSNIAEYRECDLLPPGACVYEQFNSHLVAADTRCIPHPYIITDTFDNIIGDINKKQVPVALTGYVLAYTFLPSRIYHKGDIMCSAPGGTIDKMTPSELKEHPESIVGTVSDIPDYEEWNNGKIQVNGRIWINLR